MSAKRSRQVLIAAIVASLLLHLIFAGYFRWSNVPSVEGQPEVIRVQHIRVARIQTPPPTPPPTPAPTPIVHASIAPPVVRTHTLSGPGLHVAHGTPATPAPASTPVPTPVPEATRAVSCVSTTTGPAIESTPTMPPIPPDARASKKSGTAAIAVQLDPQGRVTGTSVAQTSGDSGLDAVAAQMATNATYVPKVENCKAVASTYTFTVQFVAW